MVMMAERAEDIYGAVDTETDDMKVLYLDALTLVAVSYTHLTLPTILLV